MLLQIPWVGGNSAMRTCPGQTTMSLRLLHLLAALLTTLLFAAAPAAADAPPPAAVSFAADDVYAQPSKHVDHSSKRPRNTASLEEFFEIDDDAEQYFKTPAALVHWQSEFTLVSGCASPTCPSAVRSHRACAAYPTGPPHA